MATTSEILEAVNTLADEFKEFKDVCHSKQSACRGEIHSRINRTGERVAAIEGRHKLENGSRVHRREDEETPSVHKRATDKGFLKSMDMKERVFFIMLGTLLGKDAVKQLFLLVFQ